MSDAARPKEIVYVRCTNDTVAAIPSEQEAWVRTGPRCKDCAAPSPMWDYRPFEWTMCDQPVGSLQYCEGFNVLHDDLLRALKPFLEHVHYAPVFWQNGSQRLQQPYTLFYVHRDWIFEAYRGKWSRHTPCRVCGVFKTKNAAYHPVIAARYLDHRRVYVDDVQQLFIDKALVKELDMKKRFPDLRFHNVPIVPEPLDGDVMPGDPGWNGTFVEQRNPRPEEHELKYVKGMRLYL